LTAKDLINYCGMEDNPRRFMKMSEDDLQLNLSRVKDDALKEALTFGIGLHHAGLVESDRSLAEELFANNKIQILIATSTLAWGVNLPAHLVVVKGTQFFDGKTQGYKDMELTDVLQMLGRAGRPQFDTTGIARIFTQDAKKDYYKHFLHTGLPVESTLHKVLDDHLGAEVSAGTITTVQDALDYLTWTFFFRRLHKNPTYYGLELDPEDHNTTAAQQLANDYMIDMVDKSLRELGESRCLELYPNGNVDPTPLGKIMSYYYISHMTMRHLVTHAKRDATFEDVLFWMTSATEYDELPVRHNEDLVNAELAKNLPIDVKSFGDLPMWDPHLKSFLLLQCYMSRIELPLSDYVGDSNSVLDQSIRIIQASIDALVEMGYLSSTLQMMVLLQCIKSARWPTDHPLSILPGVGAEGPPSRSRGKGKSQATPATLQELSRLPQIELQKLATTLSVEPSSQNQFAKAAMMIPDLDVKVTDVTSLSIHVTITRRNAITARDSRVWAPLYPKPQTEGYFVVVAESGTDEILAVKRVGWGGSRGGADQSAGIGSKPSNKTTIKLPDPRDLSGGKWKDRKVDVYVVSDSYIGYKIDVKGVEIPAPPVVEDGKKDKP
jgi:antiviral helicase SLH1